MDDVEQGEVAPVGRQLQAAREAKGLTLEDIAAQTRIPRRHLESLESGDWDRLPAPTYTLGFAKSYASALGLDRTEIGDQLRAEMGGTRPATPTAEVFEPADPARTMPKTLVLGALAGIVLVVLVLTWLSNRSLEGDAPDEQQNAAAASPAAQTPAPAAAPPAQLAQGPVVLTATGPAWIQVTDGGRTLFQGELAAGQRYEVPATATAPQLRAGAPEALQVTVGGRPAPQVGPAGVVASNISLLGPDLMRGGRQAAPPAEAPAPNVAPPAAVVQ